MTNQKRGRPKKGEGGDEVVTNIKITKAAHAKLAILAGLWGCSQSEVIERLTAPHEADIEYVIQRRAALEGR